MNFVVDPVAVRAVEGFLVLTVVVGRFVVAVVDCVVR